jgi:PTH1 family peptidyl-tRNA hydrolase
MSGISILIGLGNPGKIYRHTRHNLGGETLDLVVKRHRLKWRKAAGPVMESRLQLAGREVLLLKPLTFMNVSGEALSGYGDLDPGILLAIFDDINLPLGRLRLRKRGGSGGHRGIESVVRYLGTEDFARLRLGVGAPPPGIEWSEYVLSPFPNEERKRVGRMIATAADALEIVLQQGIETAMDMYNSKDSEEYREA